MHNLSAAGCALAWAGVPLELGSIVAVKLDEGTLRRPCAGGGVLDEAGGCLVACGRPPAGRRGARRPAPGRALAEEAAAAGARSVWQRSALDSTRLARATPRP